MQEIHTLMLPCPQPFSSSTMSAVALADTKSLHAKPAHRRDISDELDVFEAAGYYSEVADAASFRSGVTSHRAMKEDRYALRGGGERRSIDVPIGGPLPSLSHKKTEKHSTDTKSKQPISPGSRLASFLNSFFHQGSSKKKSKSTTTSATQSCKDEDEKSLGGRSKKRSSITPSHSIRSSKSSFICSSSSGFQTPPSGKVKEEVRAHPRNKCNGQPMSASSCPPSEDFREGRSNYGDFPWESSRRGFTNGIFLEKGSCYYGKSVLERDAGIYGASFSEKGWIVNKDRKGIVCKDLLKVDQCPSKERNLWRRQEADDGGESDSSSDLFELPNYDLDHLSSGLPVYETTSMERIMRGSSIANVFL